MYVGDTLAVTYVDEAHFYVTRTGEFADDTTPEEFLKYKIIKGHDVEYTICALVGIPYSMRYRYILGTGICAVVSSKVITRDCGENIYAMAYIFDTPDETAEAAAESFLADYTAGERSGLMYESKAILRKDFEDFCNMFLLVGSVLCFVIGLVGILNFFNAILTGILTRRREFAMLQSVGMTGKQLKQMLIYEAVFYAVAACGISILLILIVNPLAANVLNSILAFFSYRFTIWPVMLVAPVFAVLGVALPLTVYYFAVKKSIVERLRETE